MNISNDLISYFKQQLSVDVTEDTPLIENGIIDSMGVIELVTHVSEKYQIEFSGDDMTEENFGTVRAFAKLIQTLVG